MTPLCFTLFVKLLFYSFEQAVYYLKGFQFESSGAARFSSYFTISAEKYSVEQILSDSNICLNKWNVKRLQIPYLFLLVIMIRATLIWRLHKRFDITGLFKKCVDTLIGIVNSDLNTYNVISYAGSNVKNTFDLIANLSSEAWDMTFDIYMLYWKNSSNHRHSSDNKITKDLINPLLTFKMSNYSCSLNKNPSIIRKSDTQYFTRDNFRTLHSHYQHLLRKMKNNRYKIHF